MTHRESIQEVKTAMKQATNPRDDERYQAVYLSLSGYSNQEIDRRIISRCGHTVGNDVRVYKEKGSSGLDRGKPPGEKIEFDGRTTRSSQRNDRV